MNTKEQEDSSDKETQEQINKSRREFLRKSKYAAYTTPLMLSMVVDAHAAVGSCNNLGSNKPACRP